MPTLLLRLAAPLQAWGNSSKFDIRSTEREPTKSGVIGMIAAAMGIQRNDSPERLKPFTDLRFGVRVEREGTLLKDFHMVYSGDLSDSERRHTKPKGKHMYSTERYYLSDAVFLVALESDNDELLKEIIRAINNPVYPLFLGRRSCPPTLPIVIGIRSDEMTNILRNEEVLDDNKDYSRRIVYEVNNNGKLVQDVPISFSQQHRQHGFRMINEDIIENPEHDPFSELEVNE